MRDLLDNKRKGLAFFDSKPDYKDINQCFVADSTYLRWNRDRNAFDGNSFGSHRAEEYPENDAVE
jgi:hypothetical protein